jgi:hypothetical protein
MTKIIQVKNPPKPQTLKNQDILHHTEREINEVWKFKDEGKVNA